MTSSEAEEELKKPYCMFNIRMNDRAWRVEKNDIGLFRTLFGRKDDERNKFFFALPKVPEEVWFKMTSLFTFYADRKLEAACCLLFDTEKQEYSIAVPPQSVQGASVDYDISVIYDYLDCHPSVIWVADFHSHHQMLAFYSMTDDKNERGTRLYGVFGNFDPVTREYDIIMRAGCHGMYVRIDAADILDKYEDRLKWYNKIKPIFVPTAWIRSVKCPGGTI